MTKQHTHIKLRLTRDEARYLIVLAGVHSANDDKAHGIVVPDGNGLMDSVQYGAYTSAIDQYTKRFGASPVSGSLTDDAIFLTLDAADSWASDQYSEYGVEIDSSCFNPEDDEAYN